MFRKEFFIAKKKKVDQKKMVHSTSWPVIEILDMPDIELELHN